MSLRLIGSKKKLEACSSYAQRVSMVEKDAEMTITKQAELLSISKSSVYYSHSYSDSELEIMGEIDSIYTEYPYYGSRRMSKELQNR
jgi:putative transposase